MSDAKGPWHRDAPERPTDPRLRVALMVVLAIVLAFGLWRLSILFPGRAASDMDHAWIINLSAFFLLVASGLVFGRQIKLGEALRAISIWTAIAAVLVLAYSYQDVLYDAATRVRSELVPGYAIARNPHELVLTADESGQFVVYGRVDGARVKFVIDTGATDIVLSPHDAQRLGIDLDGLTYSSEFETANGLGRGAPSTVESLSVGPIRLTHVPVSINQAPMDSSLLGMSFLRRLDSFTLEGRKLTLRAH